MIFTGFQSDIIYTVTYDYRITDYVSSVAVGLLYRSEITKIV